MWYQIANQADHIINKTNGMRSDDGGSLTEQPRNP